MPSEVVDVNSWTSPACYPRGSFYPISHGPSTRDRRVTRPCFHICSTHKSRSQASLCPYTLRTIANRAEDAFGLLRYSLGGDRPSQTAHQTLSFARIHGTKLGGSWHKGGISTLALPDPEAGLQSLPPILRMRHKTPISGYSKGSRGLSVLLRERGIFTASVISPSLLLRHCSSDYAIHARRNLPDKELRYLRTVIVTAAVYRGLGCQLLRIAPNDRLP